MNLMIKGLILIILKFDRNKKIRLEINLIGFMSFVILLSQAECTSSHGISISI
jgi:hypothetical protein